MINILDFYTSWCSPCKTLSPILDLIEKDFKDIKIEKINIEIEEDRAEEYNIRSIPTLIFFKDNKQVYRNSGSITRNSILEIIKKINDNEAIRI